MPDVGWTRIPHLWCLGTVENHSKNGKKRGTLL